MKERSLTRLITVAIGNQKGGVGKTSTTVYLAAALARAGKKVLLVDIDPQSSLTKYFFNPEALTETMYHLLIEEKILTPLKLGDMISLLPTNKDLAAAEVLLPAKTNHEKRLSKALRKYSQDYCLIDCPPSLGVLNRNALTAANKVLIPVSTEKMAEETIPLFKGTIDDIIESELNERLKIWRILPTMYVTNEVESKLTLAELHDQYNSLVYTEPVNKRTIYKRAKREHLDINDLDTELGAYWNRLAWQLIRESEAN
jgi:chromosome partitioning protein